MLLYNARITTKLISFFIILPHPPKHFHTHILSPTFCSMWIHEEWNFKTNFLYLYYAIKQQLLGKRNLHIYWFKNAKKWVKLCSSYIHLNISNAVILQDFVFVANKIFLSILSLASSYDLFYHFIDKKRTVGFSEGSACKLMTFPPFKDPDSDSRNGTDSSVWLPKQVLGLIHLSWLKS